MATLLLLFYDDQGTNRKDKLIPEVILKPRIYYVFMRFQAKDLTKQCNYFYPNMILFVAFLAVKNAPC